ncbi:unnamed protein product [Ambrosiozyma monospora]|uniref:Unnamed protein product n=1 Tax=Ambrosiozyma monospora TaxID=43982 RepID=A0ACB5T0S6_AMBMO|nr:unnamed protein product [Ambrosiozyma monospora]
MPYVYISATATASALTFPCDPEVNKCYFENGTEDSYFGEYAPYLVELLDAALSPKYPAPNTFSAKSIKYLSTKESLESVFDLLDQYPQESVPVVIANAETLCHSINDLVSNQHEDLIAFQERQLGLITQLKYCTNYQALYESHMTPGTRMVYANIEKELDFTMGEEQHSLGFKLDQQLRLIESVLSCLGDAVTCYLQPTDTKLFTGLIREIIKLCGSQLAEARKFETLPEDDAAARKLEMVIQETHLEVSYRVTQAGIDAITKLAGALKFGALDFLFLSLFGLDFNKLFSEEGTLFMISNQLKTPSFETWVKLDILQFILKTESDDLLYKSDYNVSRSLLNKIELLLDQALEFDQTTGCDEKLVEFMSVWEPIRRAIVTCYYHHSLA